MTARSRAGRDDPDRAVHDDRIDRQRSGAVGLPQFRLEYEADAAVLQPLVGDAARVLEVRLLGCRRSR